MPFGRLGALSYAARTAATLRQAIEIVARYAQLFCDGATVDLRVQGKRAFLRLGSTVPAPRVITDFTISTWYLNRGHPFARREIGYECWFACSKPDRTTEYDRTFTQAGVRFGAPFDGFAFSREVLDFPLLSADSTVHLLCRQQLDVSMAHLTRRRSFAGTVRNIIMRDIV